MSVIHQPDSTTRIILGIDPGVAIVGYAVVEARGDAPRMIACDVISSTIYQYRLTGEEADGLVPGIFAALPITGFTLIHYQDGSVNEQAKGQILAGQEAHDNAALPLYETDR
jgi:hypothetical protein